MDGLPAGPIYINDPSLARRLVPSSARGACGTRYGERRPGANGGGAGQEKGVWSSYPYGASSETLGLLGRVYKDRWQDASKAGDELEAAGYLDCAIDSYVQGFEADSRDAYPSINALTLLGLRDGPDDREQIGELRPVVRFAVKQRLRYSKPDYWDHATLLELAVPGSEHDAARRHLQAALAAVEENWTATTTADNLTMIRDARDGTTDVEWLDEVIVALRARAAR